MLSHKNEELVDDNDETNPEYHHLVITQDLSYLKIDDTKFWLDISSFRLYSAIKSKYHQNVCVLFVK